MNKLLSRLMLFASPLGIACLLVGQFLLDKTEYVSLVKYNLLAIYTAAFLAALFQTLINPSRNKRR